MDPISTGNPFDDASRLLAAGVGSRRAALKLLGGGTLGAVLASLGLVEAVEAKRRACPRRRKCGGKCCRAGQLCLDGACVNPPPDVPPPPPPSELADLQERMRRGANSDRDK